MKKSGFQTTRSSGRFKDYAQKSLRLGTVSLLLFWGMISPDKPLHAESMAWCDSVQVSVGTTFSDDERLAFWTWANQDGRVPQEDNSVFTRIRFGKQADTEKTLDWLYGVDVTARSNTTQAIRVTDAWAGLAYQKFLLTVGQKSEHFGLADSLLTSGSEVYSRNAPPIAKVALSTNGYVEITDGFAANAYLAHGWMGDDFYVPDAYLHQKFLYLRLGDTRPDSGMNFYAGLHDLALWGGQGQPSSFSDFLRVFAGSSGDSDATLSDQDNALGDHRGTIEFALRSKGQTRDWYVYAQSMYEDGSGLRFWDPGDYLVGASLIFKKTDSPFKRINIEYLDTRVTSGSHNEPDNYFSNGAYGGWVNDGFAIGTPFISFVEAADGRWIPQNRIKAVSGAVLASFSDYVNPLVRVAWIRNSGSFSAPLSDDEKTTTVALGLANTIRLSREWSLGQQFNVDFHNDSEPLFGGCLSITRTWN